MTIPLHHQSNHQCRLYPSSLVEGKIFYLGIINSTFRCVLLSSTKKDCTIPMSVSAVQQQFHGLFHHACFPTLIAPILLYVSTCIHVRHKRSSKHIACSKDCFTSIQHSVSHDQKMSAPLIPNQKTSSPDWSYYNQLDVVGKLPSPSFRHQYFGEWLPELHYHHL